MSTPTKVTAHRSSIAERFARDTEKHEMTVLHNDGLYRHLRFRRPDSGIYQFDLITVPGTLIFQGDGDSFVFSRITDMLEFFRGPVGHINPGYWAEKLTSRSPDQAMKYDEELFIAQVNEAVTEAVRDDPTLTGLGEAVQRDVFEDFDCSFETEALRAVDEFRFYKSPSDRYDSRIAPDFQFEDVWEWNCRDYDWWFLWACHAIVWGIAQFDCSAQAS